MRKLHPKQERILGLLRDNVDTPLSLAELSRQAEIDSPGVLYHHLGQLEKKGLLKRNPNNPKDYTVMDTPEKAVVYLNKYGLAQCGPDGFFLDDSVVDRIPIATTFLRYPSSEAFIVEASGNSMEPNIHKGDILIARKQSQPQSNDIVVCVHNGKAIVKQFIRLGDRIVLNSFNKETDLIEPKDNFSVVGVVTNIIHMSKLLP